MKKLFTLFLIVMGLSGCSIELDRNVYYVDEQFVLINKTQREMVVGGNSKNVRIWTIQRVVVDGDSIMVAEINDRGCGCGIISDDLWAKRRVGDTLYFEYINKERFVLSKLDWWGDVTVKPVETQQTNNPLAPEPAINFNNSLERDRKILELERQILSLQLELNKLREN